MIYSLGYQKNMLKYNSHIIKIIITIYLNMIFENSNNNPHRNLHMFNNLYIKYNLKVNYYILIIGVFFIECHL